MCQPVENAPNKKSEKSENIAFLATLDWSDFVATMAKPNLYSLCFSIPVLCIIEFLAFSCSSISMLARIAANSWNYTSYLCQNCNPKINVFLFFTFLPYLTCNFDTDNWYLFKRLLQFWQALTMIFKRLQPLSIFIANWMNCGHVKMGTIVKSTPGAILKRFPWRIIFTAEKIDFSWSLKQES